MPESRDLVLLMPPVFISIFVHLNRIVQDINITVFLCFYHLMLLKGVDATSSVHLIATHTVTALLITGCVCISCILLLPSSLLDQLTMDKRDSDGFFSRRLVCTCKSSDSSYNSTDSSLITVDYQQRFLACIVCNKTADQAYTHMCIATLHIT